MAMHIYGAGIVAADSADAGADIAGPAGAPVSHPGPQLQLPRRIVLLGCANLCIGSSFLLAAGKFELSATAGPRLCDCRDKGVAIATSSSSELSAAQYASVQPVWLRNQTPCPPHGLKTLQNQTCKGQRHGPGRQGRQADR